MTAIWMDTWHCAGWSRELASAPLGRKVLGRDVVLFRDATGTARALGARCPHRGADLAQGEVVDGCLQCPFHGWRFDGLGKCVDVPSQPPSLKISTQACVPAFALRECEGVLWIRIGNGGASGEPPEDPVRPPGQSGRRLFLDAQLIAAPFLTVLENAFDKAHVPFIHAGTFGPDQDPLVARQRIILDADGQGLSVEDDPGSPWQTAPRVPRGWLGRLLRLRAPVAQHTRFDVPDVTQLRLEYPDGTYDLFVTRITPADAEHTWLFVESVRTRAPYAIGDWFLRRTIDRVFDEGTRETTLVLGAGPDDPARPVSVESDRAAIAVRQLYERWAGERGVEAKIAGAAVAR